MPWDTVDSRDTRPEGPALAVGAFVAVDLDENNAHMYPDGGTAFGWGVVKHGHGLQAFGDGYMPRRVAVARAAVLNAGGLASDVPNRLEWVDPPESHDDLRDDVPASSDPVGGGY